MLKVGWLPLADRIVVMEAGHITQSGSFDYLNSIPGVIQDLILQQPGSYDEKQAEEAEAKKKISESSKAPEPELLAAGSTREWSVYGYYAASLGLSRSLVYLLTTCSSAGVLAYQSKLFSGVYCVLLILEKDVWLENWASSEDISKTTMYITVYAGLVVATLTFFFMMCL